MKGKKMAVVGNGATGIQVAQSAAREVDQLGVYIRTPNTCIPMNQGKVDPEKAKKVGCLFISSTQFSNIVLMASLRGCVGSRDDGRQTWS